MRKEIIDMINKLYDEIVNELYKEVETANISTHKFFDLVSSYNCYIKRNNLDLPYLYDIRKTEEMRELLNDNTNVYFDDLVQTYNEFMDNDININNRLCCIVYVNKENAVINNTYKAILNIISCHLKEIVREVFINPFEKGYMKLYKDLFGKFFVEEE